MIERQPTATAIRRNGDGASLVLDLTGRLADRALELRGRLAILAEERLCAREAGLDHDQAYMEDLESEIAGTRTMLTGAVLLQLTALRASLDGAMSG